MLAVNISLIVALSAPAVAVDYRWNQGFGQGTFEASIQNRTGSSLTVACPAGSEDTTPSLYLQTQAVPMPKGKLVDIQIIVDGANYPFNVNEGTYLAAGRGFRQNLDNLVDAMRKSKKPTFVVEYPKAGKSETFSLLNARTALTIDRKSVLSGC